MEPGIFFQFQKTTILESMTVKIYIFILIISLTFISACTTSQGSPENQQEIVIADETTNQNKDELVITDADLNGKVLQNSSNEKKPEEQTVVLEDNSKITTTFDGYNNKTETRCFVNHPRLDCIVVKTPAQGKKQIIIYPFGNGAKYLDENSSEKALSASPDELANLAGISETRDDIARKPVSPYGGKNDSANLRPLPSSEFPVFPKQISQVSVEQIDETQIEENISKSPTQAEIKTSKSKFEDEK